MPYYQITINIPHIHFDDYITCIEKYNKIDESDDSTLDYIHACEIGKDKKHEHIHSYTYIEYDKVSALKKQLQRQFARKYPTTKGSVLQLKRHDGKKLGYFVKEHKELHYKQRTNLTKEHIKELHTNWIKNRKDWSKINKDDRKTLEKYLLNNYNDDIDHHPKNCKPRELLEYQLTYMIDKYLEYKTTNSVGINKFREKDFLRMIICKINKNYLQAYKKSLKTELLNEMCDFS